MVNYKTTREGITYKTFSYTEDEYTRAREVSLTSLASSLGYTPFRIGTHYSLKEMDSLIIYNDRSWHRWSGKGDITGGSQIDFMLAFGGCGNVPEAINQLLQFKGERIADRHTYEDMPKKERREFKLPERNVNQKRLFAYLIQTRGLSPEVVSDFVHRNLIYEEAAHHNIVYCGRDPDGNIKYAGLRGTADQYGKKFKMDVPGNDKNYGVNIVNMASSDLKVFESTIDCMSYIDIYGDQESNKLVLGMVEDNPLRQFLQDYDHIRKITFCLDNDAAGQKVIWGEAGKNRVGLKEKYEKLGYEVAVQLPESGKDFNESLIDMRKSEPYRRPHGR